jgi:hypothetical protein
VLGDFYRFISVQIIQHKKVSNMNSRSLSQRMHNSNDFL